MVNSPPTISEPPSRVAFLDEGGAPNRWWAQWFDQMILRVGGPTGRPVAGDVAVFETTIGFAALGSAASVPVLPALTGEQWCVREIRLSGAGTNFSGGDRLLDIRQGTTIYSAIPAATLQALAAARWGDTGVPYPATAVHLTTPTAAGESVVATYSGGATDYTAGELTVVITAERFA